MCDLGRTALPNKQGFHAEPSASPCLPELLCPVGSPSALEAAIEGGADAIYLGGSAFNARMNAANFDREQLTQAVRLAHLYGVKVYLTLNTLLYDREARDYLATAEAAAEAGVDALIVADIGGASLIHRALPSLPLHASTQMSSHNADAGRMLADMGFCRMVVARELSCENLQRVVASSPIEIEAFVHGALCVCHSGQCLFSSLVGGRSGNRGECAQPCRLPYRAAGDKKDSYPLSLKDLTLASHVPALLSTGVASLKIEGRMKSPAYVLTVTRIWRRLLDERRAANADELRALSDAFSRNGFTDGYFTHRIGKEMLGIRSAQDKQQSAQISPDFTGMTRTLPLDIRVEIRPDAPIQATATARGRTVRVTGAVPEAAKTAPLTEETILRQISRLGGTPYALRNAECIVAPGLMLPLSALNQLRRAVVEALSEATHPAPVLRNQVVALPQSHSRAEVDQERTARFAHPRQITPAAARYFNICYLPLHLLAGSKDEIDLVRSHGGEVGAVLPEVITDCEMPTVEKLVETARELGIRRVLVGNLGHIALARAYDMRLDGDFRLNVTNGESAAVLHSMGLETLLLSPELTLPRIRDIKGAVRTVIYGRIPLMILEKCVTHDLYGCKVCREDQPVLIDRKGVQFPILRAYDHRSLICNSTPTYMADRIAELRKHNIGGAHFLFTVETPAAVDAVIDAYQSGMAPQGPVRRIGV